jgi:hypothetical protein
MRSVRYHPGKQVAVGMACVPTAVQRADAGWVQRCLGLCFGARPLGADVHERVLDAAAAPQQGEEQRARGQGNSGVGAGQQRDRLTEAVPVRSSAERTTAGLRRSMRASAASTASTGLSCLLWSWVHSSVRLSSIGASSEAAIAALKRTRM